MSHYDAHYDDHPGLPGSRSPALDEERLPDTVRSAARTAADTDSELTALRRNLLLYGTAGEVARTRVEVRAS
jgi:hypothetical protein